MPNYTFKCGEGHYFDEFVPLSSFRREGVCPECSTAARLVIVSVPHFNIDTEDRNGFNVGAGRYFSNRSERKEWMATNDVMEVGPEDSHRAEQELREAREANGRSPILKATGK